MHSKSNISFKRATSLLSRGCTIVFLSWFMLGCGFGNSNSGNDDGGGNIDGNSDAVSDVGSHDQVTGSGNSNSGNDDGGGNTDGNSDAGSDVGSHDQVTISVTIESTNAGGVVVSAPAGIDCSTSCEASFPKGSETIDFTATPDSESIFVGWKGDCSGDICAVDSTKDYNVVAVFEQKVQPLSITKLSMIDRDTNTVLPGYEDMKSGISLNLNDLSTYSLRFLVDTSDDVASVKIEMDGIKFLATIDNEIPYSLVTPKNSGTNWSLFQGEHTLLITAYSEDDGKGTAGESLSVKFTVVDNQMSMTKSKLNFVAQTYGEASKSESIKLSNKSDVNVRFNITGVPDWLNVTPISGLVSNLNSTEIEFTSMNCYSDGKDEAVLNISSDKFNRTIPVSRICATASDFELRLE